MESRQLLSVSLASAVATPISAIPTGDPTAPVVADFDGDGKPDVIVAFPSPSAIDAGYIQFGKGDGTGNFTFSTEVSAGIFTGKPAVGDFNGDGHLDLAVTNAFGGQVLVLRGNGDGTFAAAQTFAAGVSPEPLAVADFNGDAMTDLVVGNRSDNTVEIFPGNATTTLGTPTTLNTAADPASLAVADFTGSGNLSIVVGASGGETASSGFLQYFAGNGDGTFSATPINTAGPRGVTAVADLNRDGSTDIIVGVGSNDRADALLSNGDGTFTLTKGSTGASGVAAPVAADMDQNSTADLVTAVAGTIEVLPGLGDGTFGKVVRFDAAGGSGPAVADLNGDGRPDVLTIDATEGIQAGRTLNVSLGRLAGPDLAIAFPTQPPAELVIGAIQKLPVVITNHGNEALNAAVAVRVLLSTDSTVDKTDSLELQDFPKLKLKPGRSKTIVLKVELAGDSGDFFLGAQVDPDGLAGDLNLADNTTASVQTSHLADAFVDLTAAMPSFSPGPLAVGQKGVVTVVTTNAGNTVAAGRLGVGLTTSLDATLDDQDIIIQVVTKRVKINPGSSKTFTLKFRVPASVTPGQYFLLGVVNTSGAISESDSTNNVIASSMAVVITA